MPFYSLAITPLIRSLHGMTKQVWYADDAQAAGSLSSLRAWWDRIVSNGPAFGYFANANKTVLVVKAENALLANKIFQGTGIRITEGSRDLGAAIGNANFVKEYVQKKVSDWCMQMETLSQIATASPHAAHAAFTHGFRHRWTFLQRTLPHISEAFQPLENIIREKSFRQYWGDA